MYFWGLPTLIYSLFLGTLFFLPADTLPHKESVYLNSSFSNYEESLDLYLPSQKPFYHGVASGDPLQHQVIIWTRVTPEQAGPVEGTWEVALDTEFQFLVAGGSFQTDSSRDYTIKIDV